jgi:hypothetical protein
MGKKSGLIENAVEETAPSAKDSVKETPKAETPVVEIPKQETTIAGYPSRDFKHRFNG